MKARARSDSSGYTRAFGALIVICACQISSAQQAFEVVSIRPKDPKASLRPSSRETPGRLEWISVSPADLLVRAYGVERFQLVGLPPWARTERYDLQATFPSETPRQLMPAMLRVLLADRFGVKVRHEKRTTSVYELKVGPSKLKIRDVVAIDELSKPYIGTEKSRIFWDRTTGLPGDELREIADLDTYTLVTADTWYAYRTLPGGVRDFDAARVNMRQFSGWLASALDRPVLDRTGLTGLYQFRIVLPPVRTMLVVRRSETETPSEPSGVSLFRAVEELGFVLERADVPFDYLIVEQIEKASPN